MSISRWQNGLGLIAGLFFVFARRLIWVSIRAFTGIGTGMAEG